MPTGPGFPGATNVFIPGTNRDANNRLIIGFSRNPKKFALPRYCQIVPIEEPLGYYLKITAQEAARVVNVKDWVWPEGHNRPQRTGTESCNFLPFRTERYDYGFTIGSKTAKYASWPIIEQHSAIHAAKGMTNRTIRVWNAVTTTANWTAGTGTGNDPDLSSNHTDTATNQGGGFWDQGTSTAPYIKNAMDKIATLIALDTLGVVGDSPASFVWVINPHTAKLMASSPEIHDYIRGSPEAQEELRRGLGPNNRFGLPSYLYGYELVVEQTVRVTSRVGATLARSFVVPDQTAVCFSVVGGLEGTYGGPSFSTMSLFALEEFNIERFDDPKNRLTEGHVVEDTAEILTAPASGFYLTNVTSVAA